MFYEKMNRQMKEGEHLISAYPFSEKQRRRLGTIAEKNGYQVITIRLTGDIDVLYERSRKRDLSPSRHLGHLMAHYHKGDVLEDREGADMLVTYDIFRQRCLDRGYDKFELGHLIEVDVTSYDKIDYPGKGHTDQKIGLLKKSVRMCRCDKESGSFAAGKLKILLTFHIVFE